MLLGGGIAHRDVVGFVVEDEFSGEAAEDEAAARFGESGRNAFEV